MPSGGGAPKPTTTTSQASWSPEQASIMNPVVEAAKNYGRTPLTPPGAINSDEPNGNWASGWNMLTNQARDMQGEISGMQNTVNGTVGDMRGAGSAGVDELIAAGAPAGQGLGQLISGIGDAQAANQFMMSGDLLRPETNPVLAEQSQAAVAPVMRALTETALPQVRSEFIGGNMFGSSRQGIAEGRAIDAAVREAQNATTQLQMNNFNQGLGAMISSAGSTLGAGTSATGQGLNALGQGSGQALNTMIQAMIMEPKLQELSLLPGQVTAGVGQQQEDRWKDVRSENNQLSMVEQMLPFLQAQDLASLAGSFGNGKSVSESQIPGPDRGNQTLGGLLMLGRLAAGGI